MQLSRQRLLQETLRRYLRRQAWGHLDRLIQKSRVEDLAAVLEGFNDKDRQTVFERLPDPAARANLIVYMKPPFGKRVLDPLPPAQAAAILAEMASDDRADILADLEESQREQVLAVLDRESKDEVEDLMSYADDTAGGIMLPEFVALPSETTAEEALIALRERSDDVEMANYIYVINDDQQLVGVLSLRKLVTAPPQRRIRDVMESDVITVTPDTDQEHVARLVSDYGLLAIPVVDEQQKLLGIVTVDDVIGVLEEEAHEDLLKMAGAGSPVTESEGFLPHVKNRFPWLLASCVGGIASALVMGAFESTLEAHHFFALFLPIILGMSGNVGTQSATVTVRGLALGQIAVGDRTLTTLRREVLIGLTLGLVYALIVGLIAALMGEEPLDGLAIGLSMALGMTFASTIGTVVPLVLARLNVDPAVATGPFVTTSLDLLGVAIYFGVSIPIALATAGP
ncbi:MAG: magnesium transporter [Deltaproteobacteria bacterium]|nr:magnesium transporter [Deltaproteobacteria bacterium]